MNLLKFSLIPLSFFIFACSKEEPIQPTPPQPVTTLLAKADNVNLSFSYPARLVSEEDVIIKPKVSGAVVKKFFKAGDKIQKDELLFLIEPEKYQANVEMAKAAKLVAEANYENASKDHERNEILISKQAISQKEYDTSLASFNSARANLESANAQLESAILDLNYTSVRAPFNGIVGDALVNVGEYVNASSSQLVRLTNLNPIYADFYISDLEKLNIEKNLADGSWQIQNVDASIKIDGKDLRGKLYFVDSVIDENSGSVKAKAVFDNNDSRLLPGTFTTLTSGGFVQKNAFKIPQIAILQDARNTYVYTLSADSKVQKTVVKLSYQTNDFVVVSEGLKEGDKIIIDNFKKIHPGATVQEVATQTPQG
ncbi:efflux RND transporter periplasmic adaptor subunit [Campylobacter troglodytis]|uniref:efflux RND transporter periplasmic adaptor subunit n=1 Tax=Campylobacter troglodytis TaxID=654363 RepID=UPI001157CAFF|nr:efflux RND transporter periplasmic adaptor subunit [Campylobacter troglodytis]TQR61501.1 efflux RND transporter periplasmic adaptor subunit [Campylobacter troglodytis]